MHYSIVQFDYSSTISVQARRQCRSRAPPSPSRARWAARSPRNASAVARPTWSCGTHRDGMPAWRVRGPGAHIILTHRLWIMNALRDPIMDYEHRSAALLCITSYTTYSCTAVCTSTCTRGVHTRQLRSKSLLLSLSHSHFEFFFRTTTGKCILPGYPPWKVPVLRVV